MEPKLLERPAGTARPGRDLSLDLIRAVACFLVVSVHFFMYIGLYNHPMEGARMFLMTTARMGFMTCVPLFIMLTGYLCRKKTLSKRYYLSLVRILITYALCALVCRLFYLWQGEPLDVGIYFRTLLDFTGAPYAWYIEMYIGLFLLIPFLNLIWNGLDRQGRLVLVATMLFLTTVPASLNIGRFIVPDWWAVIYPISYYFLGAWVGEYQPRISWGRGLMQLAVVVLSAGILTYCGAKGGEFTANEFTGWAGPTTVLATFLTFVLLRQVPVDRAPKWLRWVISKGAELSLSIYLLSFCFDNLFYPKLNAVVWEVTDRMPYFFTMVLAVYLCSALAAQVLTWVQKGITWGLNRLFPKLGLK